MSLDVDGNLGNYDNRLTVWAWTAPDPTEGYQSDAYQSGGEDDQSAGDDDGSR